jgi:hypothetical protein
MTAKRFFFILFLLTVPRIILAQQTDSLKFIRPVSDSAYMHFNLIMNIGGGFEQLSTGIQTSDGTQVKISPGGGAGIGIQAGYLMLQSRLDISVAFSGQWSSLNPSISNGEGTFSRTLIEPAAKYVFFLRNRNKTISAGAGIVFSNGPETDIDAGKITNGAHNIFEYENATGAVILAEYLARRKKLGLSIGLKYYSITYDLKSISSNGINIPLSYIPPELIEDIRVVDGSGIDITIGIGLYID